MYKLNGYLAGMFLVKHQINAHFITLFLNLDLLEFGQAVGKPGAHRGSIGFLVIFNGMDQIGGYKLCTLIYIRILDCCIT